ncbi:DUF4124 domain-containing protein [Thalassolituus sp. LLYu03]|uniref:DUF4124 domain-containing protein n=1 Tax=Thalassolituus sp. LLYu03 TaxID=3421656 RepID=UPI003D29A2B6
MVWMTRLFSVLVLTLVAAEVSWTLSSVEQREQAKRVWPLAAINDLSAYAPLLAQLTGWRPAPAEEQPPASPLSTATNSSEQRPESLVKPTAEAPTSDDNPPEAIGIGDEPGLMRRLSHGFGGCYKPPTQDIREVSSSGVYRWTDEQGRVHFSDAPQHQSAENLTDRYRADMQGVRFRFEYPEGQADPELEQALKREGELVYRLLTRFIPQTAWRQINLNVLVFANERAYDDYKRQQGMAQDWAAHYSRGVNRIYMPQMPNRLSTLAIGRHEMTHAMVAGMVGTLPTWLNEGLAEYMERMRWQLSAATVAMPPGLFRWLEQQGSAPGQVLTLSHDEFSAVAMTRHYRQSAALVYFLLSHSRGQQWLKDTLAQALAAPCTPFQAEQAFAGYPGGLAGMNSEYARWLRAGRFDAHHY